MKHRLTILLAATLIATCAHSQDALQAARQGNECYRATDYAAAIDNYEAVISQGKHSADLYYNLGNAYYREGQYASAILNYERALLLDPNMRDAKDNLALANSQTIDRITPMPQLLITKWYNQLTQNPTPWQIIWLLLLAVVCGALLMMLLGHEMRLKRNGLYVGAVALAFFIFSTVMMFASSSRLSSHNNAIIMEPTLGLKSSPEPQSTDRLILHEGTKVHLLETLGSWYRVSIADGTTGWCEADAVEKI